MVFLFLILFVGSVFGVVGMMVVFFLGIFIRKKVLEMVLIGFGVVFLSYFFGRLMEVVFYVLVF